ncbi:MAG: NAD(P)-dependent oxidoreductase [Erysipelothrix sp.]|jgi:3-hydroxyisobutyrate dehydrogenase-like beta-hydroxyacid dehydrogenase|nr:NAD(P)-dependent oxidoreductase [Erysipelothrix sp.]
MKIAWIGVGIMGYAMANHLIDANYDLKVYNRSPQKSERLKHKAQVCYRIADVVKDADVIFTMVSLPEDVRSVYLDDGIIKHAKRGAICVDMTTSSPSLAQTIHKEAIKKGISVLDAPVSGGDVGAKNASLTIMVGGDVQAYEKVLPLLKHMGKTITHVGGVGMGHHMKLANQIAVANNLLGAIEALAYAQAVDLDQALMIHVLSGGAANSWQLQVNGQLIIAQNYEPGFMNVHFIKDLRLVLAEAAAHQQSLPMVEKILSMLESHDEASFQQEATIALYRDYIMA